MAIPYNFYFLHADCKVVKLPYYARISGKVKGKIQKYVGTKKYFNQVRSILHFEIKETTFEFDYFTAISGVFFANYIDMFHKPLVLMVILRC